jgi:putative redox protein
MLYTFEVFFDRINFQLPARFPMTVTVNTVSSEGFRHSVQIDDHELFADVPPSAGGEGSAPEPHDYFDAALGACKALTLKLYAKKKGQYALHVKLTLKGVLTDAQREELHRVADRCPIHKLMTTSDVSIETHLSEGAFSQ